MKTLLAIPKGKAVSAPTRGYDIISKRGCRYWFGPEWTRDVGKGYGRILPVAIHSGVALHMLSKDGKLSYIRGSIQLGFMGWHHENKDNIVPWRQDFEVDCLLLGMEPADLLLSDWLYVDA